MEAINDIEGLIQGPLFQEVYYPSICTPQNQHIL
jgi:hypothetical protein